MIQTTTANNCDYFFVFVLMLFCFFSLHFSLIVCLGTWLTVCCRIWRTNSSSFLLLLLLLLLGYYYYFDKFQDGERQPFLTPLLRMRTEFCFCSTWQRLAFSECCPIYTAPSIVRENVWSKAKKCKKSRFFWIFKKNVKKR